MCAYAAKHRVLMRAQNPNLCTARAKCASSSAIAQGWLRPRASEASAYVLPVPDTAVTHFFTEMGLGVVS